MTSSRYLLVLFALCAPPLAARDAGAPNVVVILTDDQGYADLSFNPRHAPEVATPHMDALAREGVFFNQAYTSGSVCSPTRAGLMLGRYQQRVGVYTAGDGGRGFDPRIRIFPKFLPRSYRSTAIGKWHLGLDNDYPRLAYHAMSRGFSECFKFMGRGGHDYFTSGGVKSQDPQPIYRGKTRTEHQGYLTDVLSREAVEFIDRNKERPFFLYLAYNAVHAPKQAPKETIAKYRKRFPDLSSDRQILMAMLDHLDRGIGEVIAKLKKEKCFDNTLLFFLTDNGGSKGMSADNTPLRGHKGSLYEGGVRTPFVVSWPRRFEGGRRIAAPVISLDILPTVLDAIGAESKSAIGAGPEFDGRSLLPLLEGETTRHHERLFWSEGGLTGEWAVREGDWKLRADKEKRELFHLGRDQSETKDVSGKNPNVVKRLEKLYSAWLAPMPNPIGAGDKHWSGGEGTKKERKAKDRDAKRRRREERRKKRRSAESASDSSGVRETPSVSVVRAVTDAAAPLEQEKPAAPPTRPNIVMFLIDDQDFEQLSVYGGKTYTPHLDQLAKEGMKFTQAYVSSTVCTPSRYSFLTGRYAGNSYHPSFLEECPKGKQGFVAFNVGLEDDNMNVGALLAANGYATGYVGKYHVHGSESGGAQGRAALRKNAKASAETAAICKANELACREELKKRGFTWAKHVYWGNMKGPWSRHNPDWTMDAAIEFVDQHKDKPFYLHYCSTLLHGPSKSGRRAMDHPECTGQGPVKPSAETLDRRKKLLALMKRKGVSENRAGETWIDSALGRLMAKLKELGIDKNTLVVFAPDHGSSNKGSLYAHNGNRIPMIMRWPAQIPAGSTCELMVQNIDLVPTFFDVAGVQAPKSYRIDGRSLKPLLKTGKTDSWRDHLYFEMGTGRALLTKDWKYIAIRYTKDQVLRIRKASPAQLPKLMCPLGRMGIGMRGVDHPGFWHEDQLYNVSKDPHEMTNLTNSPEHAPTVSEMREKLTRVLRKFDRPFGELIPGGDATEPGQVDDQLVIVRKIKVQGKTVVVPPELGSTQTSGQRKNKERKRKERERKRKERKKTRR